MHDPEQDQTEQSVHHSIGVGRRQLLTTAAGLLVPAAGLLASSDDAAAGRASRKRRRRRRRNEQAPPVGTFWSDDTIVKLINHTPNEWTVSAISSDSGWRETKLAPGEESGWNPGVPAGSFSSELSLTVEWAKGLRPDGFPNLHSYELRVKNPDVGKPDASLYTRDENSRPVSLIEKSMGEGELISTKHGGYELFLHRWQDGDETFEGDTSEYCRFVLRIVRS